MSDFLNMKNVKRTRKIHMCDLCKDKIPIHTQAYFYSGQADGEFYSYYLCPTCKTLTDEFPETCIDFDGYINEFWLAEFMSDYKCENAKELLVKLREERDNAEKQKTDNLG